MHRSIFSLLSNFDIKLCTTCHTLFPVFLFCHVQVNLFFHQALSVFILLLSLLISWSACDLLIRFYFVSAVCYLFFFKLFSWSVLWPWWMYLKNLSILTLLTVIYCKFILFFLLFPVKRVYIFMHLLIYC